jgi:glycosyltransferase involved in cell wall biosynthesis
MSIPSVSIVMPVYNAAPYVAEALDSMLRQDHTDFECIVIDDGSTDGSDAVISGFKDPRIRHLRNEANKGLVSTLNRGLRESRGRYIARMDGDDISLPGRLSKQVAYLDAYPQVDVVASVVRLVDASGNATGYWKEDREHVTGESIRDFLPVNNCIAHPSIMARAETLKAFGYQDSQKQAEDYDLWLRLTAAGKVIHKIAEPLLLHRILPRSFTRQRQRNVFFKLAETKLRFALQELRSGNRGPMVIRTGLGSFADYGKGYLKELKKWMSPE